MPYLEKVNREELLTAVCIVFSLDKKKSNKLWADNDEDSTNEPSTPSSPTPSQSQAQASSHTGSSVINLLSDNEASDGENPKASPCS